MNLKYLNKLTKILLGIVTVLVIAVVAGININFNSQKSDLSVVALANVEALAQTESDSGFKGYCEEKVNSCFFSCPSCGVLSSAPKDGPSYGVTGTCTICGHSM